MRPKIIFAAIQVSIIFAIGSHAQPGGIVSHEGKSLGIQCSDPEDSRVLESLLDDFIQKKMEQDHIPGIVFVLVKDGEIILSKGYGYADVEKKIPVKPDETVFRVGSVAKLFTATGIMQLYDQGKIDLHTDVNDYLEAFKLAENYPDPVTAAHLLTHTAGFRGRAIGTLTRSASGRKSLGAFLADNIPERSMPPGSVISYSNNGFYLAGYLIEILSGQSFTQYMENHILSPLSMKKSSFLMPPHLLPSLAEGYSYNKGAYQVVPLEYFVCESSPAGSLIATAEDIARFMIAHLQGGLFQGKRILNVSTCRMMHEQQAVNDPRLPSMKAMVSGR
jgi:CubicO group peptidase (beta-lactamase class C family)